MYMQENLLQKDGKNIRGMFSSIARFYDFLNHLLSLNLDKSWRKFAVKVSGVQANDKVLDVCSGTGDLAIAFSRKLDSSGKVIGSDFCHEMLKISCSKILKLSLKKRIQITEADALNLPFQDNMFHVSAVAFGIRNVSNLENGIKEMCRVVVPGGKVVILEFAQPTNYLFRQIYYLYFKKILPLIGGLISKSDVQAYTYLPNSVMAFPDRDSLKRKMEDNGLGDVKIYNRSFGIVAIHVGIKS